MILAAAAAGSFAAGACVDLESLGNGTRAGDASVDAQLETSGTSCPTDAAPLFSDDFDDPDVDAAARWPGAPGFIISPTHIGNAGFARIAPGEPRSNSPPYAVEFSARRAAGEALPFILFAKDLGPKGVRSPAVALSADVKVEELALAADSGTIDAAGSFPGAPPGPRTSVLGLVSLVPGLDGVQAVFSPTSVELVSGNSDRSLAKVVVVSSASLLTVTFAAQWMRVGLVVGPPELVEKFARRQSLSAVVCPRTRPAVAAMWASLPLGSVACVEADDGFVNVPEQRLGATTGTAIDLPGSVRVRVDSVRVEEVWDCAD